MVRHGKSHGQGTRERPPLRRTILAGTKIPTFFRPSFRKLPEKQDRHFARVRPAHVSTLSMLRQLNNYRKTSLTKNRNMNGPSFSCRTLQSPLPWSLDAHENQSSVTHATVSTMPNRRPTRRRDHQFARVVAGFSPQQRDLFRKSPKFA